MDVGGMDFDMILTLLQVKGMYSALIHVFTVRLNNYASLLEVLFEEVIDKGDTDALEGEGRRRGREAKE